MYHSMAKSDTTVYSWGYNYYGQLGNNSTMNAIIPVIITTLTDAKYIDAGFSHSAAVTSNNVMTWGNNENGELGNGFYTNSRIPVAVKGLVTP